VTTGMVAADAKRHNGTAAKRQPAAVPVSELLTDTMLDTYGYLLLPISVMQTAGSAAQTVAGIRSHWGRKTFADERTIAVAACLAESTVRRRHLPKLYRHRLMCFRMIDSQKGKRREWYFTTDMQAAGYFTKKSVTLPRWAALSLAEWSHRAIYAAVLQRSLATARGSKNGPVELDNEAVLWGGYGRHNFSLSNLSKITGLGRHAVIEAKSYLLHHGWLTWDTGYGRGEELFINGDKTIPVATLQKASQTTRAMMFSKRKEQANGQL
jgi:hypothetical protein